MEMSYKDACYNGTIFKLFKLKKKNVTRFTLRSTLTFLPHIFNFHSNIILNIEYFNILKKKVKSNISFTKFNKSHS
jgi:hypothetical protein